MALTTITFETLLERNGKLLEKKGVDPETLKNIWETIEGLTGRQRRKVLDLFSKREELVVLASTRNQRQAYGAEQWEQDFMRLGDVERCEGTEKEGRELREFLWSKVPNSRFKRFQELFCKPEEYVVPPFRFVGKNVVSYGRGTDFHAMSLRGCLVSPDRIPDDLAQNMRLCEFTEEEYRRPELRLRKKHAAVERLKMMWEAAEPLQPKHHRILVISSPSEEVAQRYTGVEGPHPDALGTILYVRENGNGDAAHPRTAQHFSSAYGAYRKTLHEERLYKKELEDLTALQTKLEDFIQECDAMWKHPEQREDLRAKAGAIVGECITALERCSNKYKVEARDFARQAQGLRDGLGRENISAAMSKMVAIINRFNKRYADATPKGGFNAQDRMTLGRQIKQQQDSLFQYRKSLEAGSKELAQGNAQPLAAAHPQSLERVTLQPLRFYSEHLTAMHRSLDASLERGDRAGVIDTAVRMHVFGKFQAVRSWFEKLKEDMVDARKVSVRNIRAFVDALYQLFTTYQVFPDHELKRYSGAFNELARGLEGLQRELSLYQGKEMDLDMREDLCRHLKAYVELYDIEQLAKAFTK
ncbi:MAG: hypothetical protein WCV62_01275 [Candidatus Peribacteraceae bacterium]